MSLILKNQIVRLKHEGESSLADDIALPPAKRKRPCSDATLVQLMRIAIEGPDQTAVSFDEFLDVFKEKNHKNSTLKAHSLH